MSAKTEKIILGIDPGLADTGYGLIETSQDKLTLLDFGSIKTAKTSTLPARLLKLEKKLSQIIKKNKPDLVVIEKLFFNRNVTTAMTVSQARGVVILTVAKAKLPIIELTPPQVKLGVTGHGRADKKQVQQMVKVILNLKTIPQPDDAADALAMAICVSSNPRLYQTAYDLN